ncbi:MAG: glycerate kinase [Halothiobacillus sp.]
MDAPMHVLLCPDSFKGSLSSEEVARAMALGVRAVDGRATTELKPMADGGEGMADLVTQALGGERRAASVRSSDGSAVTAQWGWIPARKMAIVEAASTCGLNLIAPEERDPWRFDTRGVGDVLRHVLDAGAEEILIGLGGSGTNDAGTGLLAALGVVFLDATGKSLVPTPSGLVALDRVDFSHLDPRIENTALVFLTDVDNPLTGPLGASAVFGPQKGLAPETIGEMDARLATIAQKIAAARPLNCSTDAHGMGAAGGLGFALGAVLGGHRHRGSEYLAELVGLDAAIERADVVITGEGALDAQTAHGKVVAEVARRAGLARKPVICIAGSVHSSPEQVAQMGLWGVWGLCTDDIGVEEAIARAEELIVKRTTQAVGAWQTASKMG